MYYQPSRQDFVWAAPWSSNAIFFARTRAVPNRDPMCGLRWDHAQDLRDDRYLVVGAGALVVPLRQILLNRAP